MSTEELGDGRSIFLPGMNLEKERARSAREAVVQQGIVVQGRELQLERADLVGPAGLRYLG